MRGLTPKITPVEADWRACQAAGNCRTALDTNAIEDFFLAEVTGRYLRITFTEGYAGQTHHQPAEVDLHGRSTVDQGGACERLAARRSVVDPDEANLASCEWRVQKCESVVDNQLNYYTGAADSVADRTQTVQTDFTNVHQQRHRLHHDEHTADGASGGLCTLFRI